MTERERKKRELAYYAGTVVRAVEYVGTVVLVLLAVMFFMGG